jgi:SAM-dependent methyltransferase
VSLERATEVEKFDHYAQSYREAHRQNVRLSGEPPEYFAQHKLACLERAGVGPEQRVLDYGCGTGTLLGLSSARFRSVAGYDPSRESLAVAREQAPRASFYTDEDAIPDAAFDAAILSGVLHHVPPDERGRVVSRVVAKLAPGGRLFVFEHNPYNPLTRHAVQTCPFDDDAILLPPGEVLALLQRAALSNVRQDFVLFFPRALAALRPLEPLLRWCPLGAQTLTVGTLTVGAAGARVG